jgi:hypothetical protein
MNLDIYQKKGANWKKIYIILPLLLGVGVGVYAVLKLVGGYWSPASFYADLIEQYTASAWIYINGRIEWALGLIASVVATFAVKTKQYNTLKATSENTINQTQTFASNEVASIQNELESAKTEMQGSINTLTTEKETLAKELSATEDELKTTTAKLQETNDKYIAMQDDSSKTINQLTITNQQQADEIKTLTTQIAELKMRINDLTPHNYQ